MAFVEFTIYSMYDHISPLRTFSKKFYQIWLTSGDICSSFVPKVWLGHKHTLTH